MLPAALQAKLTPKRRRQGLYVLIAALLYSLLGLLAAPPLAEKLLKDFVADKLKLQASVSRIEINPWNLAVRLDDLKITDPQAGNETLVAAKSLYVNMNLWSSVWIRGAGLDELDLLDPYVNAHIDRNGKLNLLRLVPPSAPEEKTKPTSSPNWRITAFGLHNGHIDFKDETRPTPFSTDFSPLNVALQNLSSQPNKKGEYELAAETGRGEKFRWHGSLALQPLRSNGHLEIEDLQAITPWSYVQDSVPVIVKSGTIGIVGDYRLKVDRAVDLKLDQGLVQVRDLNVQEKVAKAPLLFSLKKIDLKGLQLDWPLHEASVQSLDLGAFAINGAAAKEPADKKEAAEKAEKREPLVKFDALGLRQIDWQAQSSTLNLQRIELDKFGLNDEKSAALFSLPALVLSNLQVQVPQQTLRIDHIKLDDGEVNLHMQRGNKIDWEAAITDLNQRIQPMLAAHSKPAAKPAPAEAQAAKPAGKPWTFALGELQLSKFRVNAEDQRFDPIVKIPVQDINMVIHPRTAADQPHQAEGSFIIGFGGKVGINGTLSEDPLAVDMKLDLQGLNIPPLAPYFADIGRFELKSGTLDVDGRFKFQQDKQLQASYAGRVAVNNFAANDLDMNQRFMAWKQLAADGIQWNLSPMSLSVKQVLADQPYSRLIITPDYKLNLQHIFADAKANTVDNKPIVKEEAAKKNEPLPPVKIGQVLVKSGSMLFADFTLKPQFATGIQDLAGTIDNISTDKSARSTINLNGRVDQYGKALITGALSPLASDQYSDLHFKFDNVEMSTMTPYSAKFAGYRIEKGKLSLDLAYKINKRQLQASNKVVLNQLTLGDKVDSPDAVNLPLKLAVAILKDGNGVINIDLPVSGSLDDPKFRVWPLVWQAFTNLLTKAATAPFKFIAGLVGGSDDMDSIAFQPGQDTLSADQAGKLQKVAQAIQQRPNLQLELHGAYDSTADALALRTAKFSADYIQAAAGSSKERKVLEAMYRKQLGSEKLEQFKALNLKPPSENDAKATLVLIEQNYVTSLRNELIAKEPLSDGDLRQLAIRRAHTMRQVLVEQDKLDDSKIFVLEPQTVTATDNQVVCKLTLNAG